MTLPNCKIIRQDFRINETNATTRKMADKNIFHFYMRIIIIEIYIHNWNIQQEGFY